MTVENATIPEKQDNPNDVRSDVLKAFESLEKPEPVVEQAEQHEEYQDEVKEESKEADQENRDEKGRFAKTEKVEAKPEPTEQKEAKPDIPPPAEWKGGAKVKWKMLPAAVKEAIVEEHTRLSEERQKFGGLSEVLTPERARALTAGYGGVSQGLENILQAVEYSNNDALGFIKWFAQSRGIDLGQLAQPQQTAALEPHLQPVIGKITDIERQLQSFQQAQLQAQQQQATNRLNSFFSNHDKYPYANDVWDDMVNLIRTRVVDPNDPDHLDKAYQKAVRLNDDVFNRMQAETQVNSQQRLAQQAIQKRQGAVSVAGAPGTAVAAQTPYNPKASVRDDVMAAWQQINGRA